MPNINQNIVDLGHVPVNRGTWEDWTAEQQSELRFYKDNIVQQGDSSYIASPVGYDPVSNPEAYVQGPPYNTTTHSINTGWKLFANGIDEFQTGERVSETSIATGTDFDNPDATKRAKVPTVGAVLDGISEGAFDLTAKTGDSYATLADALAAANSAIPVNKKMGGMSIKFVQSSDHKYVQFRYMSSSTAVVDFTNVANWQGVDDVPNAGSDNLVKSGGVDKVVSSLNGVYNTQKIFPLGESFPFTNIYLTAGEKITLEVSTSDTVTNENYFILRRQNETSNLVIVKINSQNNHVYKDYIVTQTGYYKIRALVNESIEFNVTFKCNSKTQDAALIKEIYNKIAYYEVSAGTSGEVTSGRTPIEPTSVIRVCVDGNVNGDTLDLYLFNSTESTYAKHRFTQDGVYLISSNFEIYKYQLYKTGTTSTVHFLIEGIDVIGGLKQTIQDNKIETDNDIVDLQEAAFGSKLIIGEGTSTSTYPTKEIDATQDILLNVDTLAGCTKIYIYLQRSPGSIIKTIVIDSTNVGKWIEVKTTEDIRQFQIQLSGSSPNTDITLLYANGKGSPVSEFIKQDVADIQNIVFSKIFVINKNTPTMEYPSIEIDATRKLLLNVDTLGGCSKLYIYLQRAASSIIKSVIVDSNNVGKWIRATTEEDIHYLAVQMIGSSPSSDITIQYTLDESTPSNEFVEQNLLNGVGYSLFGKKAAFCGDSIMKGDSDRTNPGSWANIIGSNNLMNYTNFGVSGARMSRQPNKPCIIDQVLALDNTYDYIIIQGACNDPWDALGEITPVYNYNGEYDTATLYGALEYLCKYLEEHFYNKKFGFIITYRFGEDNIQENLQANMEAIKNVCDKWSVPYIDLRECAGFNLINKDLRLIYGVPLANVPLYSTTSSYAIDEVVKRIVDGTYITYKANEAIAAPAGDFDETKWTQISDGELYDSWHANHVAYEQSSQKVQNWMESL